jgi:hypothetical protein
MSESFVPLAPAGNGSAEASFNPLLVKAGALRGATPAPAAAGGSAPGACSKPVITLRRNGDVVAGIRIQCGCGQVVDLSCVY